jgi:hypothetical protein
MWEFLTPFVCKKGGFVDGENGETVSVFLKSVKKRTRFIYFYML